VLLFGPRWIYALPLLLLVPAALLLRQRRAVAPIVMSCIAVWLMIDFAIPWGRVWTRGQGTTLRILSCNVDGENLNGAALGDLVFSTRPDIVSLQEWPTEARPSLTWPGGYNIYIGHGLLLASRFPLQIVDEFSDGRLGGPGGVAIADVNVHGVIVHFVDLHLSTPREGIEPLMDREISGIEDMRNSIARRAAESELISGAAHVIGPPIVLAGDFNMPCDSAIFRRNWSGFSDAFSKAGFGTGNSKFTRYWGVRIDHVLAGGDFKATDCWVGPDVGSDHRPVIADLAWTTRSN